MLAFQRHAMCFHRLNYELSQSKTTVSSTTATSITGEAGKTRLRSSLKYVLSKDTRDNRFDPNEGYFLEMDETLAGFGGDVKFLRTKLVGCLLQTAIV